MEVLQVPAELDAMVKLYKERKPKRVLEIGCWDGGTLREWLTQGSPEFVLAIDLEHRNAEAYADWVGEETELRTVVGDSSEERQVREMLCSAPFDWVFIDGDHTDAGVRADVTNTLKLISPGGLMLLHDITPPAGTSTVPPRVVWQELARDYKAWAYEFDEPAPWTRGIGVVELVSVLQDRAF